MTVVGLGEERAVAAAAVTAAEAEPHVLSLDVYAERYLFSNE